MIPALGGEARLMAKSGREPRFSPDGAHIVFVTGEGGLGGGVRAGLFTVPSLGGTPQRLVEDRIGAANPAWSPDGKWILFSTGVFRPGDWGVVPSQATSEVSPVVVPLAGFKKKSGLADVVPHEWLERNRILFSAKSGDSSHLFEIGLSPPGLPAREWRLDPSPKRLTSGTGQDERPSLASQGSAKGGRRLAFASLVRSEHIWSLTLDTNQPRAGGKAQPLTQESGFRIFPSISRDGTKLAFLSHAAHNDEVWLLDLTTGKRLLLSTTVSVKFKPIIHADGSRVVYQDQIHGDAGLYTVPSTGGAPEKLCDKCNWAWDWSADYKRVLHFSRPNSLVVGAVINLETGKRGVFLEHPGKDLHQVHWSPDGRWIVFVASQTTRSQLYVAPLASDQGPSETAWIPITDGSTREIKPSWSPDGNWIYLFSSRDGFRCLWAHPLDPHTKRPAGNPVAVLHAHGSRVSLSNANAVSQEMSVARDKIVFNQGEITGNIWMTELPD
jgi:Tol biopolymer transport system component